MVRSNYRGLKCLDQVMKVVESVLDAEGKCRHKSYVDSLVLCLFIVRQLQEKYLGKGETLHFVDNYGSGKRHLTWCHKRWCSGR